MHSEDYGPIAAWSHLVIWSHDCMALVAWPWSHGFGHMAPWRLVTWLHGFGPALFSGFADNRQHLKSMSLYC